MQKEFDGKKAAVKATFKINRVEGNKYYLKSSDGKTYDVTLVTHGEGKGELVGLPNKLSAFLFNFTEKEIYENTTDVIDVLITMYDSKGDGQANLVE